MFLKFQKNVRELLYKELVFVRNFPNFLLYVVVNILTVDALCGETLSQASLIRFNSNLRVYQCSTCLDIRLLLHKCPGGSTLHACPSQLPYFQGNNSNDTLKREFSVTLNIKIFVLFNVFNYFFIARTSIIS